MLFNSIEFALFLPLVFLLYWFVFNRNLNSQNFFLVIASFAFYGWWDWRFLFLLIFSASIDYIVGLALAKQGEQKKRRVLVAISVIVNLGLLSFFKYYNFFIESFVDAFTFLGQNINRTSIKIILPVGISFYTFQALSYSIDVYRRRLEPTRDLVSYFAFITFFPQLVAGPIERATNLLPQFYSNRHFDYTKAADGMRQILWGLFKKIVIADNCAIYANRIFDNYTDYSGSTLFVGAFFFAFQIYCDFSGYSDIAIGTARLFGFNLTRNFAFPYFSRNIAEFWRSWHISLSTWFRDYVYIPLGGSKGSKHKALRNTTIVFILSGLWHGANWTFIVWGLMNACYFAPLLLFNKNRLYTNVVAEGKILPSLTDTLQIISTFFLILIGWVFFRSSTILGAFKYLQIMFSKEIFSLPQVRPTLTLVLILIFTIIEWLQREKQHGLQIQEAKIPKIIRWGMYYAVFAIIVLYGGTQQEFVYFQF